MACRSRFRSGLFFLGLVGLFGGCSPPECAEGIDEWIDEAPDALNEFLLVREEVLTDTSFFKEQALQGDVLILDPQDTVAYSGYNLPKLTAWFRSGKSNIRIGDEYTEFHFRQCWKGRYSANGIVYYERRQHGYNPAVEMVDSVSLGNRWYAHVITCVGCGDS